MNKNTMLNILCIKINLLVISEFPLFSTESSSYVCNATKC